jgi:hypothetical protein
LAIASSLVVVVVAGCGGASSSSSTSSGSSSDQPVPAADVRAYINAVEKVRLPVNALLEGADPILDALHDKRITPNRAADRMGAMETKFAHYLLVMQEINPSNSRLKAMNTPYANTYFYEDSYLATLASDLREGDFDNLPNTQDAQRLAIIVWRTKLEVIAAQSGVTLPGDLQQAGRGEIAPGPTGS